MVGSEQGGMCAMKEIPLYSEGEKSRSAIIKENVSFIAIVYIKDDCFMLTCL